MVIKEKAEPHFKNMSTLPKAIMSWSGGKDSSYCLHQVLSQQQYQVTYLLTTINRKYQRISMHGVREALLEQQASSIGIPLLKVYVSEGTNLEYEQQMEAMLLKAKSEGIDHVIFGDIFLEDLRKYRENNLAKIGMTAVFPLWKRDTKGLVHDFIEKGFKTITCCVNDAYLDEDWAGKALDKVFFEQLPPTVDPCGENGEFHTFCHDGPIFKNPLTFTVGPKTYRPLEVKTAGTDVPPSPTKGFWFCDFIPSP